MSPQMITRQRDLDAACVAAATAGRFGLDTEFVRDKTYFARLALVQLSVGDRVMIIDPLAELDLAPLDELVNDDTVVTVLHAASQDLEIFFQRTGEGAASIFDTQVAAGMSGLGYQLGYASTVKSVLGFDLSKGSQRSDWLRRPLQEKQLRYAADDVRHLLPLMDALLERLDGFGRVEATHEEMALLCDPDRYRNTPESVASRLKGASRLRSTERTVLVRLVAWREERARYRDIPRRWVVPDAPLVDMAREAPKSRDELKHIRGLHPREVDRSHREILAAIREGLADPPLETPAKAQRVPSVAGPIVRAVVESLCSRASIAMPLVASAQAVEELVAAHVAGTLAEVGSPLLQGWRGELLGKPLLAFLEGRCSLRMDPETRCLVVETIP